MVAKQEELDALQAKLEQVNSQNSKTLEVACPRPSSRASFCPNRNLLPPLFAQNNRKHVDSLTELLSKATQESTATKVCPVPRPDKQPTNQPTTQQPHVLQSELHNTQMELQSLKRDLKQANERSSSLEVHHTPLPLAPPPASTLLTPPGVAHSLTPRRSE